MQLLLDLHAVGLERTLEVIAKSDEAGQLIIDDLGVILWSAASLFSMDFTRWTSKAALPRRWRESPCVRKGGGELELLER